MLIIFLPSVQEVTLLQQTDPFFRDNMHANFGDLGESLKAYVQTYSDKSHSTKSIESVEDMKRFVEEYPEFRRLGGNVNKHVTLVGELSRVVGRDTLLEVSEVEQGLAGSGSGHAGDLKVSIFFREVPSFTLSFQLWRFDQLIFWD